MKFRFKATQSLYDEIFKNLLSDGKEQLAFIFGQKIVCKNETIILFRELHTLDFEAYISRKVDFIQTDQSHIEAVYLKFIKSEYDVLINVHSHPFSSESAFFSAIDDRDDLKVLSHLNKMMPDDIKRIGFNTSRKPIFGSMVVDQTSFKARMYSDSKLVNVTEITLLGESIKKVYDADTVKMLNKTEIEKFDRQIRAFGKQLQENVKHFKVAICGCGGIGSNLIEMLVRLGVVDFVLIDFDRVELSNLNRLSGSTYNDIGKYKVDVMKAFIKKIEPDSNVNCVKESVEKQEAIDAIKMTDILIGGLDNTLARFKLNELSLNYMLVYLDGGSLITQKNNEINTLIRVFTMIPGYSPCMMCSPIELIEKEEIRISKLGSMMKTTFKKAGYIKEYPDEKSPAVMALNMIVASGIIQELQLLLSNNGDKASRLTVLDWLHPDSEFQIRYSQEWFHENKKQCMYCSSKLGIGDN